MVYPPFEAGWSAMHYTKHLCMLLLRASMLDRGSPWVNLLRELPCLSTHFGFLEVNYHTQVLRRVCAFLYTALLDVPVTQEAIQNTVIIA